jgi:hypothetical protein
MPSTQLVDVISLTWQHGSSSKGHLQASGIKHIKGNCTILIMFGIEISVSQICYFILFYTIWLTEQHVF